jgi:cysteine desulfurase
MEAMLPYFATIFGNASSVHSFGQEARTAVEESRESMRKALGARSAEEIFFTSGGTESDNIAVRGVAYANRDRGDHIITSSVEHHAVLETCHALEGEGFRVSCLPVDRYGMVSPDDLRKTIRAETILISIMHANNEVGTIQPVDEIGGIAREYGILFHTDAVQSFGKIPIDVERVGIDLLSLSGHKIYGPKGVGALYIRKGTPIVQISYGGSHEGNMRPGTENLPGIVGLGKAADCAVAEMTSEERRLRGLRDRLQCLIAERIDRVMMNGHPTERLAGTLNLSFIGVEGESLILSLDLEGVAVSSGSACMAGLSEPSHVLLAMGVPPRTAQSSLRFSLGRENTVEDVNRTVDLLVPIVERLRRISAFG